MLSIEEYIDRRKKEDKLNEFDIDPHTQNIKICVDYVFEYFNNYLNTTEVEGKTVLHNEKLEKYIKQLEDYEPEARKWAVNMYDEYGKQVNRYIGNMLKENDLFFYIILTANLEVYHMTAIINLLKNFHFRINTKSLDKISINLRIS